MLLCCLHFEFETGLTSIIWGKCVPEIPAINETSCSNDSSPPVLKLFFPLCFENLVKGENNIPLLLQQDGSWALTWRILPLKSAQDRANSDVAGSRSLSFRLEGTPTPWNSIEIFQQLLWKRNSMGHKLLLQPEIHFRSGQVTTLRKTVTEALTGRPWIAGTLWPEAAGGWQQNQLPEFSDSTLLQKNVSHLVPEQHLILHLQHLLLHLRESSVNQWRHQWSELIRNRQSASRFQKKVQVSTGICRAFASFPSGIWGGRRRSPGQGTCGAQIIDGVILGSWGKCLQFHHWKGVAIADFASKILWSLRKSKMCDVQKLAFRHLRKISWPSASSLSSPSNRMQSWMQMQRMSCERWSVPCATKDAYPATKETTKNIRN